MVDEMDGRVEVRKGVYLVMEGNDWILGCSVT